MHPSLSDLIALCKLNITLPVTLTTFTGFVLYDPTLGTGTFYACAGVLLLACAASVFNHVAEHKTDALMPRTQNRPVASGRTSPLAASLFALFFGIIGSILLAQNGWIPLLLGLSNMFWYVVVYTRLKRLTAFAVFPGSLVGAIPPVIGWTAAGGFIADKQIILVAFFFFIGQIPHFWLLIMRYGKDYEFAGLPSLTRIFSTSQIIRLTLVWVAATAMAAIALTVFGLIESSWIIALVLLSIISLLFFFRKWLTSKSPPDPKPAFMAINLFYLWVIIALIAGVFLLDPTMNDFLNHQGSEVNNSTQQ